MPRFKVIASVDCDVLEIVDTDCEPFDLSKRAVCIYFDIVKRERADQICALLNEEWEAFLLSLNL